MIFDTLSNFSIYRSVHPLFPLVSEFIHSHDLPSLTTGRHAIGRKITVIIDDYATRQPAGRFLEKHEGFIDVQIMLAGIETIGISPALRCISVTPYNPEKDIEHLSGEMDFVTLRENDFAVFLPDDAHLPGTTFGGISTQVRKMVVKVPFKP